MEGGVRCSFIGNVNAITYKEMLPLIRVNKRWLSPTITSGDRELRVPDSYPLTAVDYWVDDHGNKYLLIKSVRWFADIEYGRHHEQMQLMSMEDNLRFIRHKEIRELGYSQYDSYDVIEVGFTDAIPSDYAGVMGVPITLLDKYNPEQFDILGATQRGCRDLAPDTKKYDDCREMKRDGTPPGSSGGKTNENANLVMNDGKKNYVMNVEGHVVQSTYQRIFIHRHNPEPKKS